MTNKTKRQVSGQKPRYGPFLSVSTQALKRGQFLANLPISNKSPIPPTVGQIGHTSHYAPSWGIVLKLGQTAQMRLDPPILNKTGQNGHGARKHLKIITFCKN